MEAALLSTLLNNLLPVLRSLAEAKYKQYKAFQSDAKYLEGELKYIAEAIDGKLSGKNEILPISIEELRRLGHAIEDCIDRIMYRGSRKEQGLSIKSAKKTTRKELGREMRRLKRELERALSREKDYPVSLPSTSQRAPSPSDRLVPRNEQFGTNAPLEELLEQLAEEKTKLKVICIVGFCGLGKTVVAQELYNDEVSRGFKERAWVSASHMKSNVLLLEILRQLQKSPLETSTLKQLSSDLRKHLNDKTYFFVLDDLQEGVWGDIEPAFPPHCWSRVVVTTRFVPEATICSSNGYMHRIARLDGENSRKLFLKKACPEEYKNYSQPNSAAILNKCDGQPLALTAVGEFMRTKDWPKGRACNDACNQVLDHLKTDNTLDRLHQVLINDYTSLPDNNHKACFLYFAMFPSGHPVRRKALMRRWLAEGLIQPSNSCSDPADKNFIKLIDRNIIQPIDVSNNTNVKTCKTYGMMHEYILLKSFSENIIALLDNGRVQVPKHHARRLALHGSNIADGTKLKFDLSLVRSLIVTGKASKSMLDFRKYQLLRVLDLEQYTDLEYNSIKEVCNLLLLRYLSLGGKQVKRLPDEIKRLKLLETLDLRKTAIDTLNPEVIKLPNLIHLFGKFKLQNEVVQTELRNLIACKLQTLAGFVVDRNDGFSELMIRMDELRKVKIWCDPSATCDNLVTIQKSIQEFIRGGNDACKDPRSLSVHFDGCCEDFLNDLEAPSECNLWSLKLQGLQKLPVFVNSLVRLEELCLQSTTMTADLLTAVTELEHLKYLKLTADKLDQFTIKDKALPNLICLCFVVKYKPLPEIENGALQFLESLQLFGEELDDTYSTKIKYLKRLREVTLDDRFGDDVNQNLVMAAKELPRRPKVISRKAPNPSDEHRREDYVASREPENGTDTRLLPNGRPKSGINWLFGCYKDYGASS